MPLRNVVCVITGMVAGLVVFHASSEALLLNLADAAPVLGGACPNIGCVDKTCSTQNGACPRGWTGFCTVDSGKCRKIATNNFARCGDADSKPGFTCSETTNGGCAALMTGDVDAKGQCPEAQCVKSASCGTTSYTCTSTACGS
ncbi:MAG: hypothetical protein U0941_21140 [Planctomycetaceae bacterium]